ncbi:MAG TPA: hypothetical protein PLC40_00820, partial [Candidatus Hydrogenedentes bacterium]|nr:hypothetical protein [Candidatus Hydrogenedentota bacterium]
MHVVRLYGRYAGFIALSVAGFAIPGFTALPVAGFAVPGFTALSVAGFTVPGFAIQGLSIVVVGLRLVIAIVRCRFRTGKFDVWDFESSCSQISVEHE